MASTPVEKIARALSMAPPAQGIANQMASPASVPSPQASALKVPTQQAKPPAVPKAPTLNANSRIMPVLNQTTRKTLSTSTSQLGPTKLGGLAYAEDALRGGPVSKLAQLVATHPANNAPAAGNIQPPPAVNPGASPDVRPGMLPKKRAVPAAFDRALSSNRVATGLAKMPSKAQAVQAGQGQFKPAAITKLARQDTDLPYGAPQMPSKPLLSTASPSRYPKTYAATRVVEDLTGFPTASATFTPSGTKAVNQAAYTIDQKAFRNTRNAMKSGGPLDKLKALSRDPRSYALVGGPAAMTLAMPGAAASAVGHVATRAAAKLPAAVNLARMGSTIGAGRAAPAAARAAHHAHGGGGLIAAGANAIGSTIGRASPAARAAASEAITHSGRPLGHVANDMLGHEAASVMSSKGLSPKKQNAAPAPIRRAAPSLPAQNLQRPPTAPPAGQAMTPTPASKTPLVRSTAPRLVKTSAQGDFARKIGLLPPIPKVPGASSIPNTPVVGGHQYAMGRARRDLLGPERSRREWSRSASGVAEPTMSPVDFLLPGAPLAAGGTIGSKVVASSAARSAPRLVPRAIGAFQNVAKRAISYGDDLAAKAFPNAASLGPRPALAAAGRAAPTRAVRPANPVTAPLRRSGDAAGSTKGVADDLVPYGRNVPPPPGAAAPKPGLRDRVADAVNKAMSPKTPAPTAAPPMTRAQLPGAPSSSSGAADRILNIFKKQMAPPAAAAPKAPGLVSRGVSAVGRVGTGVSVGAGAVTIVGGAYHGGKAALNAPAGKRLDAFTTNFVPGMDRTSNAILSSGGDLGRKAGLGKPVVSASDLNSAFAARARSSANLFKN